MLESYKRRCFGAGPTAIGQIAAGAGVAGAETTFVAVPAASVASAADPPALETFLKQLAAVTASSSSNSSTANCSPIPEVGPTAMRILRAEFTQRLLLTWLRELMQPVGLHKDCRQLLFYSGRIGLSMTQWAVSCDLLYVGGSSRTLCVMGS